MKHYFSVIALFSALSCNNSNSNSNGSTDSVQAAKDSNQAKIDSFKTTADTSKIAASVSDADAKFAVEAANAGMMEVELGKVAEQNSSNPDVKHFGAMMVRDHTKAGDQLKTLAMSKHITLPMSPSKDDQDKMDNLGKKMGHDFDKAYINMMVSGHKKVAAMFEDEIKKGSDADIRDFATHTLDAIHTHLNSAEKIEAMLKK